MKNIVNKLANSANSGIIRLADLVLGASKAENLGELKAGAAAKEGVDSSIAKSWPKERYLLINSPDDADAVFSRLREYCYQQYLSSHASKQLWGLIKGPRVFWESGRIAPGRAYFFLKQSNKMGWLFERSGLGWVVSRANKNVEQNLFLREEEVWDIIKIYRGQKNPALLRVSTLGSGDELISYLVYERMVYQSVVADWTGANG